MNLAGRDGRLTAEKVEVGMRWRKIETACAPVAAVARGPAKGDRVSVS